VKPILQCEKVSKYFGQLAAVKNLSFFVNPGEIFGIAGPNGAGKSVLFNVITKVPYGPTSGMIMFDDQYIHKLKPHEICRLGISRSFQTPVIFPSITVLENVMIGGFFGKAKSLFRADQERVKSSSIEALDFVGLLHKKDVLAGNLLLGDEKLLMIASCLATEPKIILLDEPMGGLNPTEIEQTMDIIKKINEKGITVIAIEHIMKALMGISNRMMILHYGEKIAEGTPKEIADNELVIEAYFGEKIEFEKMT